MWSSIYPQWFFSLVFRLLTFYGLSSSLLILSSAIFNTLLNLSSEPLHLVISFQFENFYLVHFPNFLSLLTFPVCLLIKTIFSFNSLNIYPINILDIFIKIAVLKCLPAKSNIWAISHLISIEYGLHFTVSLCLVIFV